MLTIEDVAQKLNVKQSWVRDHVTRRKPLIPHYRVGNIVRFNEEDVERFMESHRRKS